MDRVARMMSNAIDGQVRTDAGTLAAYASDASNHRVLPSMVVFPKHRGDLSLIVERAVDAELPITTRGAGTGIAGSALGSGIVIDTSRWLADIATLDDATEVIVEPGVVLARLQDQLAPWGRRFGSDPSSQSRCTLGGMVGTNACGAHSIAWGTTAQNVLDIELIGADGVPRWVNEDAQLRRRLEAVADDYRPEITAELGRFERQISGYGLHYLLREDRYRGDHDHRDRDSARRDDALRDPATGVDRLAGVGPFLGVARSLVGAEGTIGLISRARLRTVMLPRVTNLVIAGFVDDVEAARSVDAIRAHHPLTIEGFGAELLETYDARERGRRVRRPGFPSGDAWLLIEMAGDDSDIANDRAHSLANDLSGVAMGVEVVADPGAQATVWRVRNRGAGLSTRTISGREAWPGWEDAAVPPDRLGDYLADFRGLMSRHGRHGVSYGHFGEGCVHIRIDHELDTPSGRAAYRAFQFEAAELVVAHGGSLSGEHGDGRARSELLPKMYSPRMIEGFAAFKQTLDPDHLFNPGIIVEPPPVDGDLRLALESTTPGPGAAPIRLGFDYPDDHDHPDRRDHDGVADLSVALRRCVGVGACRNTEGGGMCPSYRATLDERDSTRGRARILYEMLHGNLADKGWASDEVDAALDTCLGCKACATECPVSVDMATYRAEFLYQRYRKGSDRRRPRWHYSLGWLPRWLGWGRRWPGGFNRIAATRVMRRLAGVDPAQPIPTISSDRFPSNDRFPIETSRRSGQISGGAAGIGRRAVLWVDTFTAAFAPDAAAAASDVLTTLGWRVEMRGPELCCGLTYVSTGQLDRAKTALARTIETLDESPGDDTDQADDTDQKKDTVPIVVLEPSCAAMMRHDAPRLLGNQATARVAARVMTLAELIVATQGWQQALRGETSGPAVGTAQRSPLVVQFHCHQRAVIGTDADEAILHYLGIEFTSVTEGCCGQAGDFAYRPGNHELARAVAAQSVEPALRRHPKAAVLADGVSCRTQIEHIDGRTPVQFARLLRDHLGRIASA